MEIEEAESADVQAVPEPANSSSKQSFQELGRQADVVSDANSAEFVLRVDDMEKGLNLDQVVSQTKEMGGINWTVTFLLRQIESHVKQNPRYPRPSFRNEVTITPHLPKDAIAWTTILLVDSTKLVVELWRRPDTVLIGGTKTQTTDNYCFYNRQSCYLCQDSAPIKKVRVDDFRHWVNKPAADPTGTNSATVCLNLRLKEPAIPAKVVALPDNQWTDLTLILDDGSRLRTSKYLLGSISDVMDRMLTGSFREASESEIPLHDVSSESVREFLLHITPSCNKPVRFGTVLLLLDLADRLFAERVTDACDLFLVEKGKERFSKEELLNIARQYRLERLNFYAENVRFDYEERFG